MLPQDTEAPMTTFTKPTSFAPFPWMKFAYQELGRTEAGTNECKYFAGIKNAQGTPLDKTLAASDGLAWCSAFVNWCLVQAGFAGTGFLGSRHLHYEKLGCRRG
jgi:hypothetical protein